MGWLRELMDRAEPQVPSFGALARACLEHPDWPAAAQPKPRSLAALFSKLDHRVELEWLQDRTEVQLVLCRVLGCPVTAIQSQWQEAPHTSTRITRLSLPDAPQARPLELTEEPLPPGFPEIVHTPARWRRVWWKAKTGDGVSIVRTWLIARGLAHVVQAHSPEEAIPRLDPLAANFIEIESAALHFTPWPNDTFLCVVCSQSPPEPGWTLVQSPSIETVLTPLLKWLAERFPPDGRFDVEKASEWLLQRATFANDLETLIGLAALLDEANIESAEGLSLPSLAATFIAQRLHLVSAHGGTDALWLQRHGLQVLVELLKACLVESAEAPEAARSEQAWLELVPSELQRGVDAEWARTWLANAGALLPSSTLAASGDLDHALAKTPPGAFQIVRALSATRLLVRDPGGSLFLSPRWLLRTALERAEQELLASSPLELGAALLQAHSTQRLKARLLACFTEGDFSTLEALLDFEDDGNPALVAATEAAFECAGIAILSGTTAPSELLEDLLKLQAECATYAKTQRDSPRLLARPRLGWAGEPDDGGWQLAAWVLAEQLEAWHARAPEGFSFPGSDAVSSNALAEVAAFLERSDGAPWVYAAYGLLGHLLQSQGRHVHPLALPASLLERVSWSRLSELPTLRHGVAAVAHLSEQDHWPILAEAFWITWHDAGFPDTRLFLPESAGYPLLAPYLPTSTLEALIQHAHPLLNGSLVSHFTHEQLAVYLEKADDLNPRVWSLLTAEHVPAALNAGLRSRDASALRSLWQRDPNLLLQRSVDELHAGHLDTLHLLLSSAPSQQSAPLATTIDDFVTRLGTAHPAVPIAQTWLKHRCRTRDAGFRECYRVLHAIDQRMARAAKARGGATTTRPS